MGDKIFSRNIAKKYTLGCPLSQKLWSKIGLGGAGVNTGSRAIHFSKTRPKSKQKMYFFSKVIPRLVYLYHNDAIRPESTR